MRVLVAAVGVLPATPVNEVLQVVLLTLVGVGASAVALCRVPVRQVLLLSIYGLLLALSFFSLQAPDVSLSELTVGAVVLPLVLLLTLSRIEQRRRSVAPKDGR